MVTPSEQKTFAKTVCADRRAVRTRASNSLGLNGLVTESRAPIFEEHDFVRHIRLCAQHDDWQPGASRVICRQTSCPEMSGKQRMEEDR